jgi:hypothetical protein
VAVMMIQRWRGSCSCRVVAMREGVAAAVAGMIGMTTKIVATNRFCR